MQPPKRALRFLRWFCREEYIDEIEGDLMEVFLKQYAISSRRANWFFAWSVVRHFRPMFMKSFKNYYQPHPYGMYRNYIKVALRNVLRHKGFTAINVAGLVLGIACALFIYLIVRYELSYDRYHAKADRIYRVNKGDPADADTGAPYGLAAALRTNFPEMEQVAIVFKLNPEQSNVEMNNELFRETNTYLVQPEFFRMIDFEWIQGTPESLGQPRHAVVTQSIAEKYFKGDAMGKVLSVNNGSDFTITGIVADPPVNTDFPIRIALSFATLENRTDSGLTENLDAGTNSFMQTFFSLREGADAAAIDPGLKQLIGRTLDKEQQKTTAFFIQPLADIHFNIGNFNQRVISRTTIHTLGIIGLVVLIIACINFINLASAQAIRRAREVGVRKTLGGTRRSLVVQFLIETLLITGASVTFAMLVCSQMIRFSEPLFGIPLSADALLHRDTFIFISMVVVGVTLLSGFYPAFILSGYRPVTALKGSASHGATGLFVRKGLITFQFFISQVLVICSIIVIRQTDHFLSKPLGFNKDAVVTFDLPDSRASVLSSLKNSLLTHATVEDVSFSLNTPSATINKWWANLKHSSFMGEERSAEIKYIDSTYLRMFEIERLAGTLDIPDQSGKYVIVNESLVHELGIDNPQEAIGEKITYWSTEATIIGVVRDFQTVTLHEGLHPVILTSTGYFAKGSVKIDMSHAAETIAAIEKHWREAFPGNYFTYAFLDDQLATFYKEETKMSRLLTSFSVVAISIGCIGLFGLIAFVVTQRAKEVSIRKILGATIVHLAAILSNDFIKLVLIAGLIAWPIAYYALDQWLQGFANRIELFDNAWAFVLSLVIAVGFALLTVSFQTIKAALVNPVDQLRSE
jgi:ABC-type antimicrobial peptide transport system permease subunit